ncbi:Transketolase 1 [Candidatus Kinetoplastibacterium sorsogonicusi]|uniref:Transketolase n=1 Tax=Candidatus Kinetoplastidibacterium kentomonadis TaxID=1576550 RepID=A0A3Q8ER28_9PROT|nr:transketolase [Candidatus Kinetoplastibacterium sorsogonicusi]AWD32263.1 Transketolase 1 [Candidatus Kinetoplastibacterium sorsogonicusi]
MLEKESTPADAIRALSMDAVQKAKSGHPGAPMGMAEIAEALWINNLNHNPTDPKWINRDRVILSNGHASMLIYSILHLTGYDLSLDDLKNFRQLHSKTPGHPEVNITPGIETTTGPLGQGLANAVGMALAESLLSSEFNKPNYDIVNHYTYVLVGDGCLMEGISHEVCSLAGTLKLSKLIVLYDSNNISIDGDIKNWFNDNTALRFESYGWNVINNVDGHNIEQINSAILQAKKQIEKPTIIICNTVIGKGSPNMSGTNKVHGSPLGSLEITATKKNIGWKEEEFVIPEYLYKQCDVRQKGLNLQKSWQSKFDTYQKKYPELAAEFIRRMSGKFVDNFDAKIASIIDSIVEKKEIIATRKASQNVIQEFSKFIPELLGGSADLTSSNLTDWKDVKPVRSGQHGIVKFGRHINYGVREFGMAAIMNGIALHGGYIPFGGTFLTFSDYSRNAIRMSALMRQKIIHIFTHDSIGLGEDGPTHQSIEHVSSLRLIPNLSVWRPCDTLETAIAWIYAIQRNSLDNVNNSGPTAILLSRQNLPFFERDKNTIKSIYRGGYILKDVDNPVAIIIATGSEVHLAMEAQLKLMQEGINVKVISMPSTDVFDQQDNNWKELVLPKELPKLAIEAGTSAFWHKYVGSNGVVIGIDSYGESAPADVLFKFFNITVDNIIKSIKNII